METKEIISPTNSGKPSRYGGSAETAQVRAETVRDILRVQTAFLFAEPTKRVHLNDTDALVATASKYIESCATAGMIPSFQGLATALGLSRNALYKFLQQNPDTPSGIFLEKCRTAFTATRQSAVDRGAAAESLTIFLLKNSNQGFTDRIEITPAEPTNPLKNLDEEAARQRIMAAIPMED